MEEYCTERRYKSLLIFVVGLASGFVTGQYTSKPQKIRLIGVDGDGKKDVIIRTYDGDRVFLERREKGMTVYRHLDEVERFGPDGSDEGLLHNTVRKKLKEVGD